MLNKIKEFKYDALDRLIFYRDEKGSAEYSYDFSHRRLSKKIFDSEGNIISEEKYLYLENKEIGSLTPDNRFITFRALLPNISSENRASVAVELLGKPYAVIHDHNGSIVSLTDIETGEAIHQARFSAFGCLIEKNTSLDMPWGFSGKRFDEETGFIFFGRRYYHPEDGRWITKDPLGEFDGPNLYAYVQNRPSILIDAYGYMAEDSSFKHAVYGIGLGAFDFMVNMFHDLERGAAYYGSSDLEMSFDDRSIMLGSVAEAQAQRMDRVDDFLADKLSFDKTDPLFQSCRAYTTLTMEVGSLAIGGYSIVSGGYRAVKAMAASRRIANMPYQALNVSRTALKETSFFNNITRTKKVLSHQVNVCSSGAENINAGLKLKRRLMSQEIAGEHAFEKHVLNQGEFPGWIRTRKQFGEHIESVISNPTHIRELGRGRCAFWHQGTGTVVIRTPSAWDGGTAFQPTQGITYLEL